MHLTLAHLPPEVLSDIFQRLTATTAFDLAVLAGNRLLSTKAHRFGMSTLSFYDYCLRNGGLKILRYFPSITQLYIQINSYEGDLDLYAMPSTLLSLEIVTPCHHWTNPCAHSPKCSASRRRQGCGTPLFNFKRYTPKLKHLTLQCTDHRTADSEQRDNAALVLRCLPTTLETLACAHLSTVDPKYWINMPAGLEITRMFEYTDFKFLEKIALHAPQVRLSHVMFYEALSHLPVTHSTRPLRVSLYMQGQDVPDEYLVKFQNVFLTQPLPSSSDTTKIYPPYLTALHGHGWTGRSTVLKESPEKIRWPSSLKTLDDGSINPPTWSDTLHLPSTITRLEMGISQEGKLHFPSTLTSMKVCYGSKDSAPLHLFEALPPILFDLSITLLTTPWDDHCLSYLPRSLPHFTLNWTPEFELTLSFFDHLPTCLPYFVTNAVCSDALLPALVDKTTDFITSTLDFTGSFIPADTTFFHFGMNGAWFPSKDGKMELRVEGNMWQYSKLRFRPVTLPSTLTHLKISSIDTTTSRFAPMFIPNLNTIELPSITHIDWTAWELPAMTHLILSAAQLPVMETLAGFPTTVTRLSYLSEDSSAERLPPFLANQLQHFDTAGFVKLLSPSFSKLTTFHARNANLSTLPALTDLKLSDYVTKDLQSIIDLFPAVRKFSNLSAWSPSSDEIEAFADRFNLIECAWISLSKLPKIDMALVNEHIKSEWPSIEEHMALQMQRNFSCLKMPPGARARMPSLSLPELHVLRDVLSAQPINSLDTSSWSAQTSKIGKFFPSSLATLHLPSNLNCGVTKHLPRSLTMLKIESTRLTCDSLRWLPPGLISLQIRLNKFLAHYAKALPSTLDKLIISANVLGINAFSHLPASLKSLEVAQSVDSELFYRGLPPNLTVLSCSHMVTGADLSRLQEMMPQLTINCRTPTPFVVPSLTPAETARVWTDRNDHLLMAIDLLDL